MINVIKDVISEVINNYLNSKCMIKENSYWGDDLQTLHACEESLKGVYGRLIDKGLTKNVYIVQQLGEIIGKLEKLTK
jgi:DNA-binding FrmR family transcriptional regulator